MATRSFLKNIVIKNNKSASSFLEALENAHEKGRKKINLNTRVETINNKEKIKKIFGA